MLGKLLVVCVLSFVARAQNPCPLDGSGDVDLSNQGLTNIDASVFDTVYDCKQFVANITSLNLSNNSIASVDVDSFAMFYELLGLNLSQNYISSLDNNTFISLRKLENLDVSYNLLTKLEVGLISLVSLQSVWFNNNNISEVDPNIVGQANVGLTYFNMNNNSLTYFDPWPYTTYQTYQRRFDREFYFQYNKISRLTNYMNWTFDLQYPFEVLVYLQYNDIQTMSVETLRQYDPDLMEDSVFAAFLTYQANITHNPFFCDCNLYPLTSIVRSGVFRYSRVEEYRFRCGSPAYFEGIDFLHDLALDQLVCNVTSNCPTGCYCEDRPHNDTFFINCTGAGLTEMPEVIPDNDRSKIELFLDDNNIATLKNTSYLSKIHNISLVGNRIESLDTDVLTVMNASRFDFRNNRISTLPEELKKYSYSTVFLHGNPLECNCNSMWLVEWLTLDSDGDMSLTCDSKTGNHRIVDISLKTLGCTNELVIIICVCLGVVLALLAIALIFAKRCPYETRVILHKLFRIRPGKKYEVDTNENKEVDIYIVFDDNNEDVIGWVRYFLKKLNRKKPIYSILNPARFMEPGSEAVNIPKWIGKSKRMIIVLSDKIFENEWRCFEIEDAERRVIEAATLQNVNNNENSNENNRNELNDTDGNEQDGACVINMGDENLENAPKIIYIIFNSSDLLKAKLDENRWIERIGDRRKLRKDNPKEFDQRAKEWQEKLQQEPWKSRLAGKAVLSPDDRMFWSKLRYELPPVGNGKGDGNFTFRRENPVPLPPPQRREDPMVNVQQNRAEMKHGRTAPISFPKFSSTTEKVGVHKNHKRQTEKQNDRRRDPSQKQMFCRNNETGENISNNGIDIFTISKTEDFNLNQPCSSKEQNKEKSTSADDTKNGLLNVLQNISGSTSKATGKPKSQLENVSNNVSDIMNVLGANGSALGKSRPGSGDKNGIDSETSRRIYTIGTKGNSPINRIIDSLGYSRTMRTMRSDTVVSNMSTSSSSSG